MGRRESDCEIVSILKDAQWQEPPSLRFENVPFDEALYDLYSAIEQLQVHGHGAEAVQRAVRLLCDRAHGDQNHQQDK